MPRKPEPTHEHWVSLTVRLPEPTRRLIADVAERLNISSSALVRGFICDGILAVEGEAGQLATFTEPGDNQSSGKAAATPEGVAKSNHQLRRLNHE